MYEGPAKSVGPVGQRELEVLGLLLASLLLTITIFVFRPAEGGGGGRGGRGGRGDGSGSGGGGLPEGWALAESWRRLGAGGLDASIAALLSGAMWNTSPLAIVDLSAMMTSEFGVWPVITAACVLVALGTIGEAAMGRSLGKWALGCRVIAGDGGRPSWKQALARNSVKALCPPLAMMAIGPMGQGSAPTFGTLVISRIHPTRDSGGSGGDGGAGEDEEGSSKDR